MIVGRLRGREAAAPRLVVLELWWAREKLETESHAAEESRLRQLRVNICVLLLAAFLTLLVPPALSAQGEGKWEIFISLLALSLAARS